MPTKKNKKQEKSTPGEELEKSAPTMNPKKKQKSKQIVKSRRKKGDEGEEQTQEVRRINVQQKKITPEKRTRTIGKRKSQAYGKRLVRHNPERDKVEEENRNIEVIPWIYFTMLFRSYNWITS